MNLSPQENERFQRTISDFRSDHDKPLRFVREKFRIPENRFFSVRSDGLVAVDLSRKRVVESLKISKSDQP